jgi:hypothetical protein
MRASPMMVVRSVLGRRSVLNRKALVDFLKSNLDVFAWKPSNMKAVPREVVEHKLNLNDRLGDQIGG